MSRNGNGLQDSAFCLVSKPSKGYLLVMENKPGEERLYSLPGGRRETKDRSPKQAALRELLEETGILKARIRKKIAVILKTNGRGTRKIFIYKAEITAGSPTPSEEHPEVRFVSYADIEKLAREGKLTHNYTLELLRLYRNRFREKTNRVIQMRA